MVKIEVGTDAGETTAWSAEFRTWARPNDVYKALSYLINLAERGAASITGFRLTNERGELE
jgi:hypothetical protein